MIAASDLSIQNPCQYCGASYQRKSAHLKSCVGIFNGVYLYQRIARGKVLKDLGVTPGSGHGQDGGRPSSGGHSGAGLDPGLGSSSRDPNIHNPFGGSERGPEQRQQCPRWWSDRQPEQEQVPRGRTRAKKARAKEGAKMEGRPSPRALSSGIPGPGRSAVPRGSISCTRPPDRPGGSRAGRDTSLPRGAGGAEDAHHDDPPRYSVRHLLEDRCPGQSGHDDVCLRSEMARDEVGDARKSWRRQCGPSSSSTW